jgi:hypothetical protein
MEESDILDSLVEEFFAQWQVTPSGGGFLITTDWILPNNERIEIHVRRVGDREDLFLVTDGGELVNFLFAQGIDLSKDDEGMKILAGVAETHGAKMTEFQMVKGAGPAAVAGAVRVLLEAVKEASFLLWTRIRRESEPVH